MAIICSTALVLPPNTIITATAFSNALRVIISRGFISRSNNKRIALPASAHSFCFSSLSAGLEDEYGKLMPNASMAEAMVLAVYIPPHAPAPGHACCIIPLKSASVNSPAIFCPKASKADTIFKSCPL